MAAAVSVPGTNGVTAAYLVVDARRFRASSLRRGGVVIDGVAYGHFTGEAQFDPDGSLALIDIERSSFQGAPLRLELDGLLIERSQLRNKYGIAFMADYPGNDVRAHRRRFDPKSQQGSGQHRFQRRQYRSHRGCGQVLDCPASDRKSCPWKNRRLRSKLHC